MRTLVSRISTVVAAIILVASCDEATTAPKRLTASAGVASTVKPLAVIDSPLVGTLVNVGDSVYVHVQVSDAQASLSNLQILGVTVKGDSSLGTFTTINRYNPISVSFRPGLTDTIIRRYLQPVNPADTTLDSLIVLAVVTDSNTNADTARVRVNLVSGPIVTILNPPAGDSVPAGIGVSVTAQAVRSIGVGVVNITVMGESTWPTLLDTTITQTYPASPQSVQLTGSAIIPANAPVHGKITITATATDVNRQPGAASPIVVYVRSANGLLPLVTQAVLPKSEISDSVKVTATGQGIVSLGIAVRDSAGNTIERDSTILPAPYSSNAQLEIPLNLPIQQQGRRIAITAYAVDQSGHTGYAVSANTQTPASSIATGITDSTVIVHGRTFALPRNGTVADIAPDSIRGNIYLSNSNFNKLEVWENATKTFDPTGVAVGSLPWGMTVSSTNHDTLLVANSGGTNISRVYIGSSTIASDQEDVTHRILTRNTYVFTATEAKDQTTGQVTITATGPFSYSNRPQYLAQSSEGRIFYSTEPTSTATAGTLRWLDPSQAVPDPVQIWQYGSYTTGTDITYALFGLDSMGVILVPAGSTASDTIFGYSHVYGSVSGFVFASDTTIEGMVAKLVAKGATQVQGILHLDITTLPLEDTTFVQASGSRNWIAFGEGNSAGAGRVMMAADSTFLASPALLSFSPLVAIQGGLNNASDHVFGLAVDKNGLVVGARGSNANFLSGQNPFHLQLQGQYPPLSAGSGIAMHPLANGGLASNGTSLAFVASASGFIEIVDLAHYNNRGTLELKYPVYGPIRATLPMPGDPPTVVLKLFAMSTNGLVVIDLTAADILPPP